MLARYFAFALIICRRVVYADIKVKEQSEENLIKGRLIFEPPRYMTAADAATQLLTILERRKRENREPGTLRLHALNDILRTGYDENTMCVAVARVGWQGQQRIVAAPLSKLAKVR